MTQEKRDSSEEQIESGRKEDFGGKSLSELVNIFQELIEKGDQQEMYKYADLLKSSFYKRLKREMASHLSTNSSMEGEANLPINREGEDEVSTNPFAELERGFKELYGRYKLERRVYIEKLEQLKEENLKTKNDIIEELKELLEKQEDLHYTFPTFRKLQSRWRETGPVPIAHNRDLWDRYQHFVERFYDYVKINNELKELDLKKNLAVKIKICEKAEALLSLENVVEAFRKLQTLHEDWREVGPVPQEVREETWNRFREASREINKRQQLYFENIKAQHKANLERKRAICEKIEKLLEEEKESWNFSKLSKEITALQSEWRSIGFATKKENQKIYDRFRASCDKFYSEKREFYSKQRKQFEDNLKSKEELCLLVESLQESQEWKKSTDQIIAAQKQWREIGPVPRKESDAIWARFRKGCDYFFSRKEEHFAHNKKDMSDNLKRKEDIITEVRELEGLDGKIEAKKSKIKEIKDRWGVIGFVPMRDKERVEEEFIEAMKEKFPSHFNEEEYLKRSKFKQQLDRAATRGERGVKYERDRLVQRFRTIEQDISLWENNIGFFAKSKKADSIIKEINQKIAAAKEEMGQIEAKIKIIDNQ
ncbi:MAG: DUF349 domain-containing protein [Bacteroidales bacterium]